MLNTTTNKSPERDCVIIRRIWVEGRALRYSFSRFRVRPRLCKVDPSRWPRQLPLFSRLLRRCNYFGRMLLLHADLIITVVRVARASRYEYLSRRIYFHGDTRADAAYL
jgi:hypothetical protein